MFDNGSGSIFDGIDETQGQQASEYLTSCEGRYILRLTKLIKGTSENPDHLNQPYVAAEFTAVQNTHVDDVGYSRGQKLSYARYLNNKYALNEIKALFAAVLDCPQSRITTEVAEQLVAEGNRWRPPAHPQTGERDDPHMAAAALECDVDDVSDKVLDALEDDRGESVLGAEIRCNVNARESDDGKTFYNPFFDRTD